MRNIIGKFIGIVCVVGMATCANAQVYTWQTTKQVASPVVAKPKAYLKVYSEAHIYYDMGVQRIDRQPYTIYSSDGKKLRFIAYNDQNPKLVMLPPGKYVIVPETRRFKAQIVDANLIQGQLTEVHFKGENPI